MINKNYLLLKRILDFFLAFILLIFLSPFFLVISIAVKLDSKGPVFFRQLRTGYKGREFELLKFRTMVFDNDVMDFKRGDTLTGVGIFLRKFSIDELPQLINILKNDMSFIGPRPWITQYYKYYTDYQKKRFKVSPGLTGLAQVCGRKNLHILDRIEYDIQYVDNLSLKNDIKIIYKTILILFEKDSNTYENYTIEDELSELRDNYYNKIKTRKDSL